MYQFRLCNLEDVKKMTKYIVKKNIGFDINNTLIKVSAESFADIVTYMKNNNIRYCYSNDNKMLCVLLKNKDFDTFSVLYNNGIIKDSMSHFLHKACRKYDAETVSFCLVDTIGIYNVRKALNISCWRTDDNVDIVRMLIDYIQYVKKNDEHMISKKLSVKSTSQSGKKTDKIPNTDNLSLSNVPLNNAVEQGNISIVNLLISYGANPAKNRCCVDLAISNNHVDVAEILVSAGAKIIFEPDVFVYQAGLNESRDQMVDFYYAHVFSKIYADFNVSSNYTSESSDYTSESSDYTSESSDYTSESSSETDIVIGNNYHYTDYISRKRDTENADIILGKALVCAAKTGHLDTVIALIELDHNYTTYLTDAIKLSKHRPHIYKYLKNV